MSYGSSWVSKTVHQGIPTAGNPYEISLSETELRFGTIEADSSNENAIERSFQILNSGGAFSGTVKVKIDHTPAPFSVRFENHLNVNFPAITIIVTFNSAYEYPEFLPRDFDLDILVNAEGVARSLRVYGTLTPPVPPDPYALEPHPDNISPTLMPGYLKPDTFTLSSWSKQGFGLLVLTIFAFFYTLIVEPRLFFRSAIRLFTSKGREALMQDWGDEINEWRDWLHKDPLPIKITPTKLIYPEPDDS